MFKIPINNKSRYAMHMEYLQQPDVDLYATLGLERKTATVDDIKGAYRSMAKQYIMMTSSCEKSAEMYQDIFRAYEVLINPLSKRNYDMLGCIAHRAPPRPNKKKPLPSAFRAATEAKTKSTTNAIQKQRAKHSEYYDILEIDADADDATIRRAYRAMAKKYHPDSNRGHDTTAHFQTVFRAYEVLHDPDLRRTYDAAGEAGLADDYEEPIPEPARPKVYVIIR
jgi:DnaJ-class molecular chaperone